MNSIIIQKTTDKQTETSDLANFSDVPQDLRQSLYRLDADQLESTKELVEKLIRDMNELEYEKGLAELAEKVALVETIETS